MTLIDVLNTEEGRDLVAQIEDLNSSLDGKQDEVLEGIRAALIKDLADRFGFEWEA